MVYIAINLSNDFAVNEKPIF